MDELRGVDDAPLTVDVSDGPEGPVIRVVGELDISSVDGLAGPLEAVLAGTPDELVFDVAGLRFMDSSGLALLLGSAARVGAVVVRSPSGPVRRVFEATGVSKLFRIEP